MISGTIRNRTVDLPEIWQGDSHPEMGSSVNRFPTPWILTLSCCCTGTASKTVLLQYDEQSNSTLCLKSEELTPIFPVQNQPKDYVINYRANLATSNYLLVNKKWRWTQTDNRVKRCCPLKLVEVQVIDSWDYCFSLMRLLCDWVLLSFLSWLVEVHAGSQIEYF